MKLLFTPKATADLAAIKDYITEASAAQTAEIFVQKLIQECAGLLQTPHAGKVQWNNPTIRKVVFGNYKIFYRTIPNGIRVIRIWHGTRGNDPV